MGIYTHGMYGLEPSTDVDDCQARSERMYEAEDCGLAIDWAEEPAHHEAPELEPAGIEEEVAHAV